MVEYPEIDRYASLDSPMHRFDPRVKIIALLSLIFSIVLLYDLKLAFIGFIISIILLLLSNLPTRFVLHHLKWVSLFIIPFLIIMPFTVEGSDIFSFYLLRATYEGLGYGLLVSIRALSAIILVFPMVATMRFDTTIKALENLRLPNYLVQMVMFTYRYIFVFVDEMQRIWRSMSSRGFEMKTSLYSIRTAGKAIGALFVRSYERAERVRHAMYARGYTGNLKTLDELEIRKADLLKAILIIGIAIGLHVV